MKRRRPLQVESPVVLRQHVLAIRLFSHFHVRNWIAALLQVSHLRGRIFRRAIQHGDRHNCGQAARDSAGEEQIKSWLISGFHAVRRDI